MDSEKQENIYFLANDAVCVICKNKSLSRKFTYLLPEQLELMRQHKPYRNKDEFCKICVLEINKLLLRINERSQMECELRI